MGESLDCVIKGGAVVTVDGSFDADVGIKDGRIEVLGRHLTQASDSVIDATGLFVLPGGIDVHTHFDTDIGGSRTADDFESGSRAAAAGGITTIPSTSHSKSKDRRYMMLLTERCAKVRPAATSTSVYTSG